MYFFLVLIFLRTGQAQKTEDSSIKIGKSYDRQKWVDPHDMFGKPSSNFDDVVDVAKSEDEVIGTDEENKENDDAQSIYHMNLVQLEKELSTCIKKSSAAKKDLLQCELKASKVTGSCDTPYFKQLVRNLTKKLKAQGFSPSGLYELLFSVSDTELDVLEKFLDDVADETDVLEKVIEILSNLKQVPRESFALLVVEYLKHIDFSVFFYLTLPTLSLFLFFIAQIKIQATWKQQLMAAFFLCFILSIPWEWARLYRIELAKKTAGSLKDIPEQCFPKRLTMIKSLKLWFEDQFTFKDDECIKYHEALLVDPLLEVSPSQAIAISTTRFFLQPVEYIAKSLGVSFKILFREIPAQWQVPVFVAGFFVVVVSLFVFSGFEIWTPLARFGVRQHQPIPLAIGQHHERIQELEGEIRDLRRIANDDGRLNQNVLPIANNREEDVRQILPRPNVAIARIEDVRAAYDDRVDAPINANQGLNEQRNLKNIPARDVPDRDIEVIAENDIGNVQEDPLVLPDGRADPMEHEEVIGAGRNNFINDLNRERNQDVIGDEGEEPILDREFVMVEHEEHGQQTEREIRNRRIMQDSMTHDELVENVSSISSNHEQ